MDKDSSINSVSFACPKCKHPVRSVDLGLFCSECNRTYPIVGGIPDFLSADEQANLGSVFGGTSGITTLKRMARKMDFLAPIYESRLFVSVLLKLSSIAGSSSQFIDGITSFHSKTLESVVGSLLDVACGPASYSRRIASQTRRFYGIDISMGMLKQGKTYIERDSIQGIRLARARVEELPFENAVFDGVICSGSLHLFPDTVLALREIARTMKPGAPLSVQTFVSGKTLINRFLQNNSWVHTFELAELQECLTRAGFTGFQHELHGIVLTFRARRAMPGS